jgi:hypothetical protein
MKTLLVALGVQLPSLAWQRRFARLVRAVWPGFRDV